MDEGTPAIPSPSPLCRELGTRTESPANTYQSMQRPSPTRTGTRFGINRVNTLFDLCWFFILQSQGHGPSERDVVFCLFFFLNQHLNFTSIHPRVSPP